jgi:hypothetical protein
MERWDKENDINRSVSIRWATVSHTQLKLHHISLWIEFQMRKRNWWRDKKGTQRLRTSRLENKGERKKKRRTRNEYIRAIDMVKVVNQNHPIHWHNNHHLRKWQAKKREARDSTKIRKRRRYQSTAVINPNMHLVQVQPRTRHAANSSHASRM